MSAVTTTVNRTGRCTPEDHHGVRVCGTHGYVDYDGVWSGLPTPCPWASRTETTPDVSGSATTIPDPAAQEQAYLAAYDPHAYTPVAVTVDVALLTIRERALCVLLVRRANPPYAGRWCLPGGFLTPDSAGHFPTLSEAAVARLVAEAGISADAATDSNLPGVHLEQLASYGDPGRDPRMAVVSVAYLAFAPDLPEPTPGAGAVEAAWLPVADTADLHLAFDHNRILADALARTRAKLEYTPLAMAFLPTTFAIGDLQDVYETVWGETLVDSDFRRKVRNTKDFLVPTGASATRAGARGGPKAALYRAGTCRQLHPPILSHATELLVR
jgi:8-oxo-dGTP diphosphatase